MVYDADIHLYDEVKNYRNSRDHGIISQISSKYMDVVKNHIENGSFGVLPGQYTPEMYFELKNLTQYESNPDTGYEEYAIIKSRDAVRDAADALYEVSTEELVKIASDELAGAKLYSDNKAILGSYSKEKANALRSVIESKQYDKLQDAYLDFALSKQTNDVLYVYMPEAKEVVIDRDNKTVTATMYSNVPLDSVKAEVMPDAGAECAYKDTVWNLSSDTVIPMFCKATGEYSYWRFTAKHEDGSRTANITSDGWITLAKEQDAIMTYPDGSTYLKENSMLHMNSNLTGEKAEIKFNPVTATEGNEFTIIFGANSADRAEVLGRTSESDRFELKVTNRKAVLYKYQNGERTKISEGNIPVEYNKENTLKIETVPVKNGTQIKLSLNGTKFINAISARKCSGGYIGFFNEKLGIKLY